MQMRNNVVCVVNLDICMNERDRASVFWRRGGDAGELTVSCRNCGLPTGPRNVQLGSGLQWVRVIRRDKVQG